MPDIQEADGFSQHQQTWLEQQQGWIEQRVAGWPNRVRS